MFNVGGGEMVLLAVLALLVFGPEGLPEIMKTVARTVRAFKAAANDFQTEVKTALEVENQKQQVAQRRRKRAVPMEQKLAAQTPALAAGDGAGSEPLEGDGTSTEPAADSALPSCEPDVPSVAADGLPVSPLDTDDPSAPAVVAADGLSVSPLDTSDPSSPAVVTPAVVANGAAHTALAESARPEEQAVPAPAESDPEPAQLPSSLEGAPAAAPIESGDDDGPGLPMQTWRRPSEPEGSLEQVV
jgi:sec-independent protein translocase protein TatB